MRPGHQHVLAAGVGHGRGAGPPRARRRFPLLQPGGTGIRQTDRRARLRLHLRRGWSDAAGDVFEVYSRSSATQAPGMAVVGPGFDVSIQPAGAATTACSDGQSEPCDERWGDYQGTAIDPTNPNTVWMGGLYQATSGGYGLGSAISSVSTTTYTLPTVTTGAATVVKGTSAKSRGNRQPPRCRDHVSHRLRADERLRRGNHRDLRRVGDDRNRGGGDAERTPAGDAYHYRAVVTESLREAPTAPTERSRPRRPRAIRNEPVRSRLKEGLIATIDTKYLACDKGCFG